MAYCLYLRKSRADIESESHGEGETLARHEKALLELAKRLRLHITEIYREVVSGETISARPVMQRLLSEVEQGAWEGVLVMEVERLARGDTIDQGIVAQTFKFSNTRIITPLKTYDPANEYDEEYFEFGLFMSRREYKTINRRLQRGRVASVREGKYVSNKAPYGYRRVKLEREKGFTLEIIPEEADVIRLIYDLYTTGEPLPDGTHKRLGVSLIVRRLNALQAPTKMGGAWAVGTIRDILINPVYCGKIRWNWRHQVKKIVDGQLVIERPRAAMEECVVVDGLHPPIIAEEQFHLAQALMAQNPPRPIGERYTVKSSLAGLVVCGLCGRRMVRRPYTNRHAPPSLMCAATSCHNVSARFSAVEKRTLDGLRDWLEEYRLQWGLTHPQDISLLDHKRRAAKRLAGELVTLDKQLASAHDLLEQGIYSTGTFLERSRVLAEKMQTAKNSLAALETEMAIDAAREESRRSIIPKVEHLLAVYHDLPDAKAKNDMLKSVLEKIVYIKKQGNRNGGTPEGFELVLYPRIPPSLPAAQK